MNRFARSVLFVASLAISMAGCKSKHPASTANTSEPVALAHGESGGEPIAPKARKASSDGHAALQTAVDPKPLAKGTIEGLDWLAKNQLDGGGWGQGDESQQMGGGGQMRDVANVADSSMALLALIRSGSTPGEGPYKDSVARGMSYVLTEIEESDDDSLFVTDVRGTRVQSKIGTYVDTFAALMVLTELKGRMGDDRSNRRLDKALKKVLAKIEKNQNSDGTWDNRGWAPVLTQSLAGKGLNRAAQSGEKVDDEVLARVEEQAAEQYDEAAGGFKGGGSAGVDLYAGAASTSALRDSSNTRKKKARLAWVKAKRTQVGADKRIAKGEMERSKLTERRADDVEDALVGRLDDPSFIQGFGNNGGEEFLSYMLVSESLVVKGGEKWESWDDNISQLVLKVQNGDGSWTGHHCITGRTFCTAAALLVLLGDRTPVPEEAQIAL